MCARVFVCVWNKRGEQEGERERVREGERYERKTDRTPGGEKTGAFGLVLETEAFRLQHLQKENKRIKSKLTLRPTLPPDICYPSTLFWGVGARLRGQVRSLTDAGRTWTRLKPSSGCRSFCPAFLLPLCRVDPVFQKSLFFYLGLRPTCLKVLFLLPATAKSPSLPPSALVPSLTFFGS